VRGTGFSIGRPAGRAEADESAPVISTAARWPPSRANAARWSRTRNDCIDERGHAALHAVGSHLHIVQSLFCRHNEGCSL
jgi:hypothetical protein